MEKEDGKGDYPQAAALKEYHGDNLARKGEVFPDIDDNEPCNADRRGR
nr:hypothetical protein [Syntrophorhabdus aromaticivorans]